MISTIRRYYLKEVVNLQNKDSLVSYRLNDSLRKIRKAFRRIFNWDGDIAFFPSPYFAKRTVYLNRPFARILSNELDEYLFQGLNHEVRVADIEFEGLMKIKQKDVISWKGEWKKQKPFCFLLQEVESMDTPVDKCDAFIFTPIEGVTIFGYRDELEPIYMGSNSVVRADRRSFKLNKNTSRFHCGTMNFPLILALSKYLNQEILKIKN